MKYYLLIFLLLNNVLSFGQDTELKADTEKNNESKVRISLFYSYDNNLSTESEVSPFGITFYDYDKLNFSLGVDVDYQIIENFAIGSGVNYSIKDMSYWSFCAICSEPVEIKAQIRFIDFPLIGKYILKFNKVEFFGKLGFINHITLKNIVEFGGEDIELENINDFYLSGKIGLGVSYPIINKHRLFFETDYSNGFTEFFKNSSYTMKTFGIRMGIQFLL